MSALLVSCVLALAVDDRIDPARLETMRTALESYLTRIRSIRVSYTLEEVLEDPAALRRLLQDHARSLSDLEREKEEARSEQVQARLVRNMRRREVLLMERPSIRLDRFFEAGPDDDARQGNHTTSVLHGDKYTHINHNSKHIVTKGLREVNPVEVLGPTLLWPLGLAIPQTSSLSIVDLLRHADLTRLVATEKYNHVETHVLKIGPGLPREFRPDNTDEHYWVRLWLAPSLDHLPIRAEYHRAGGKPIVTELSRFEDTVDHARGGNIRFPMRMTVSRSANSTFSITHVEINPALRATDFVPELPRAFTRSDGSGKVPIVRLSGGAAATRESERNTVAEARDLLTGAPAPIATERTALLAGLSSLFGVVILTTVLLYRRSRRER